MAQKFITKRNRHLFRKPVKAKIEERVVMTLPVSVKEEIVEPIVEIETLNETIEPEIIEVEEVVPETIEETVIVDEPEVVEVPKKKKNSKKVKETEETIVVEE